MKVLLFAITLGLACLVVTDETALAEQGFYLGLNVPYTTMEGDFDGSSVLIGSTDIIALPRVKGGIGLGMTAGFGIGKSAALELDVSQTNHNLNWIGSHGDAALRTFGLFFKYNFLVDQPGQPFLTYGILYNQLIIKDGSIDISNNIGDATLTGWGMDFGVGYDYFFNARYSIGGTLLYQYVEYSHADGVNESGKIDNNVNGSGLAVILGAAYHFQP
jgi:Outer membrane protein beta-barrel domain